MEIGNEISQKIRSAIKAKLVDLGVYVDDELPDYIMVMVANKKSQDQMTDDLNLFLGNNTEKFTSWLHTLLQKLQSITADPPKPPDAPPVKLEDYQNVPTQETSELEEDELLIGPEHDDFEEEASRERETVTQLLPIKSSPIAKPLVPAQPPETSSSDTITRPTTQSLVWSSRSGTSTSKTVSSSYSRESSTRRRDHSPHRDIRSRLGGSGSNRASEKSTEYTLQKQRAAVRKRRAPESVVGSIVRHDIEEEQYDPRRPLIGRVASTVRVGERRPTVPPAQQANKNLLLKAMTEAANSINKATQRLTEQVAFDEAVVDPEVPVEERSSRRGVDRERDRTGEHRYGRSGGRPRVEPRGIMRSAGSSQRITRVAPHPAPEMHSHNNNTIDRSVQLYSRSKREEVLQQFRAGLNSDSEEMSEQDFTQQPQDPVALDNRQVHMSSPAEPPAQEDVEEELRTITMAAPEEKREYDDEHMEERMDTLIESGADESDFTDEEGASRIVQEKQPDPPKERPESPKFVVTLDGVDPATLVGSGTESTDSVLDMPVDDSPKQATIVRVAPQCIASSTPLSLSALSIDLDESDYFMDAESDGIPHKRNKGIERCKFWLACRNGNQCPYHHPSAPCKMFPKCKFGDKCLYIHPNCRFDANCTRANCPYTHATKRSGQVGAAGAMPLVIQPLNVMAAPSAFHPTFSTPVITAPHQGPAQTTCRFFPKCTNMSCKYLHPKPCRYGVSCRDKANCSFTHPELPPANKLKWSAPKINRSLDSMTTMR